MVVQGISTRQVIGTIATAHRVWYDGKQPQPERLVDESGLPDHLRPTWKG
jgi:hypothetical protein